MAPEASQPTWKTTLGFAERVAVINQMSVPLNPMFILLRIYDDRRLIRDTY